MNDKQLCQQGFMQSEVVQAFTDEIVGEGVPISRAVSKLKKERRGASRYKPFRDGLGIASGLSSDLCLSVYIHTDKSQEVIYLSYPISRSQLGRCIQCGSRISSSIT